MSAARAAVVVLAKAPVPGRVKTRLCPPCTPAEAALLAEAALVDTLCAVGAVPAADPATAELALDEVAQSLGVSLSTAKRRVASAEARLQLGGRDE